MSRAPAIFLGTIILSLLSLVTIIFPTFPTLTFGFLGTNVEETKILFVGDVFLGRYVETLIKENTPDYPFTGLNSLVKKYDYIIGNFEAPIREQHEQTPINSMSFSVATSSIETLKNYFSFFSLANNHTFDGGAKDLAFTRQTLLANKVGVFGDPNTVDASTVTYISHNGSQIAIIGINAVTEFSASSTAALLAEVSKQSAMQIVFIHWGEEYKLVHDSKQQEMAYQLIDSGADVIIGAHPHVVQDIGVYKGVPIFYSLGNFVFDQYFSDEVQVGLGVELTLKNNEIAYSLIPFTALESKSSPRLMTINEKQSFMNTLSAKSDPSIAEKIRASGTFYLSDALASL